MSLGQVLAGNIIYADDIQDELDALEARLKLRARSTVATTMSSATTGTTFTNLTGLTVPVLANSVYKMRGRLKITGANATHDCKFQWSLPALATVEWSAYNGAAASVTNAINSIDTGSTSGSHVRGTFAGTLTIPIEGTITTGANAGNALLQGAQNVSDAGVLSFDAGSEFSLEPWV